MGLFAKIFDNNDYSKHRRQKTRICRIEEMESRDLLSASPYSPPDPIDFGVIYHEEYVQNQTGQTEDYQGDAFTVSWNGGAEHTKLTAITIDLSANPNAHLYFNVNPDAPQGENNNAWNFQVSENSDIKNCTFALSNYGQTVTITFGEDFTADKVFKFTVDVNERLNDSSIAPIVNGATFDGVKTSAVFESENYEDAKIDTRFNNTYTVPSNVNVPNDDYGSPELSQKAATAGAVLTGYEQTPLTGRISGFVYDDANNNGIKEEGDKGIGNVNLSLWAWDNDTQQYVDTGKTATTHTDGYYEFTDVEAFKQYQIRETQPDGYEDGKETVGSLDGELPSVDNDTIGAINMPAGGIGEHYNFAEYKNGSVSGHVLDDERTPIPGTTVELYDDEGNKIGETVTDENGYYEFTDLPPDEYVVREIHPEGYCEGGREIGNLGGALSSENEHQIDNVIIRSGDEGIEYNFLANRRGEIGGYVYVDSNKNGVRDSGELGIKDAELALWKWNEETQTYENTGKTARTDADGHYFFAELCPLETYQIRESQPENYLDGKESIGSLGGSQTDNDILGEINLPPAGLGENYNFGELEKPEIPPPDPTPDPGSLSGYVYLDANKDGVRNSGELGIGNTMVILERFDGEKYVAVAQTQTDVGGYYVFNDLEPDATYRVTEVQPTGYEQGTNTAGSLGGTVSGDTIGNILLPEEAAGINYNFGEQLSSPEIPPPPPVEIPSSTPDPLPSPKLPGPGGALGQPGVASAPAWQAPYLTDSMRTGFGTGGVMASAQTYNWHLSVVNAGYPRSNGLTDGITANDFASQTTMILSDSERSSLSDSAARYVSVAWTPLPMNQSGWYVRGKDGVVRKRFSFGPDGGVPVVGDFSGDGIANLAVYQDGNWYIDVNGDGKWDEEDLWAQMGGAADQPVSGDWDGDGKTDIGVFGPQWSGDQQVLAGEAGLPSDLNTLVPQVPKNVPPNVSINVAMNNVRAMKHSQSGGVRLDVVDHVFQYGNEGDQGFTGDFTGDGISTIGVYREGKWYIDRTGSGKWDDNAILVNNADHGLGTGGVPVIGDFDGDGIDNIGLYVDGIWHLDTTGDFKFDTRIEFGEAGDYPVVGDFDGSGIAQLAVYRASTADSLYAANAPESAPATGAGMVARQFGGEEQGAVPNEESLQHHERSVSTPHTNAPLMRGQ